MFGISLRSWCRQIVTAGPVMAGLLLSGVALAQEPDGKEYLEQVRRLNEVAAQKLETDVQSALRAADRLRLKEPAKAADELKRALTQVEGDTALSQTRRDGLKRLLQARLRVVEGAAPQRENDRAAPAPVPASGQVNRPAALSEPETIRRTLETIRGLQKEGRQDEARRLADDLARRFPSNPAVQATLQTASSGSQLANSRLQRFDMDRRLAATSNDVSRAAQPAAGDVEFPRDWQERLKNRTGSVIPLTDKEKAILKSLNATVAVRFKNTAFEEAIKYLSDQIGQPILIDRTALQEASVNYQTPVTMEIPRVAARTVLRKLLSEFGLSYIIRDQTIEVTTTLKAKETMVTRTYYLGDLVGIGQFGGLFELQRGGVLYTQQMLAKQVQQIIELIQTSVDPSSWKENGGNGTIAFNGPTMTLVIKQSAEVHGMIAGYLK